MRRWFTVFMFLAAAAAPVFAHGFQIIDLRVDADGDVIRIDGSFDPEDLAHRLRTLGMTGVLTTPDADDADAWSQLGTPVALLLARDLPVVQGTAPDWDRSAVITHDGTLVQVRFSGRLIANAPPPMFALQLFPDHVPSPVYRVSQGGAPPLMFAQGDRFGLMDVAAAGAANTEHTAAVPTADQADPTPGRGFWWFLGQGIVHVVPQGLDHVLFVLGLFLAASGWRALLAAITAFTAAHSLTLSLAVLGWIDAGPQAWLVESIIAGSLAIVVVEVLLPATQRPRVRPWVLAAAFGLIHGIGFAGALGELLADDAHLLAALVGFNLGVEVAQVGVVAAAGLLVGWARGYRWYRPVVAIPAASVIAALGLTWMVQRWM